MWLIIGSNGQFGHCMVDFLQKKSIEHVAATRRDLDICELDSVASLFDLLQPTVVINAAAWTAVDDAENFESEAHAVNAVGASNVAKAARDHGSRLIHVSTDYVFNGQANCPYKVDDPTSPLNAYGRTKLAGDTAVLQIGQGHFSVVRTAWLYSQYGKNFAKTMVVRALRGEPVRVVNDQVGQPTSAHDLSKLIWRIALLEHAPAIVHGTNSGQATWFEFAKEIYSLLGADTDLVSPVETSAFPTVAKRPGYSVLDHSDLDNYGILPMQNWKNGLAEIITQIRHEVEKASTQ